MRCIRTLAIAWILAAPAARAGEICELAVEELVGAARQNEPVRMGIPLPKGTAREVTELALTDPTGKPVPCQFTEVARWRLDDRSLRWVHAVFQTSVAAKGRTVVKLVKGTAARSERKVDVAEGPGAVTLSNGVLRLTIKGPGFNLFDSASFNGAEVVKPHTEGFVAVIDGKVHRPGPDSKAEVAERGSEGAVVKVTGKLVPDGAGAAGPFEYTCYVHVYAGSPAVRVSFSYTNCHVDPALVGRKIPDSEDGTQRAAEPGSKVALGDLSLVLPTTLGGGRATVGGEGRNFSGQTAKILAKTSDLSEIVVDGAAAGTAKGKSTKPLTIGWVDVASGERGLAVGCRWFWQMFPKAMEASADGKLRAALWAGEDGQPLDVYMGQGRTHYLTFLFHGPADDATLSNFFAGTQMPLRAVASPRYYCRQTQAFGPLADADPALYPADLAELARQYDGIIRKSAEAIESRIDGTSYQGVTLDSYGYVPWGDVFHWANDNGVTDPWNILWESNYYDYPWACTVQFARTGEMMYLDILDRHGLHLADVFMCKWHPDKRYCGACRYSPPANHVGLDKSYKTPKPYVSVEFNHHKAQSILARYYLLGDLRARDDFMLALNNATLNPEGSWRQCRGPAAKLWTLTEGYLLTGSDAAMKMMKTTAAAGAAMAAKGGGLGCGPDKSRNPDALFCHGLALEGLVRYWWVTQDPEAVKTAKIMTDFIVDTNRGPDNTTPNAAMGLAFVWRQTGEQKYRDAAVACLKHVKALRRPKQYGQYLRSTGYAWYYLSTLGEAKADK